MEELKKCPFCGGVPIVFESSNGPFAFGKYVVCGKCGCQTLLYTGKDAEEKAIESWNKRKPVENVLERLRHEIEKSCLASMEGDKRASIANHAYNKANKIVKEETSVILK